MNSEKHMHKDESTPDLGILSGLNKKDVFLTPAGYFDDLNASISSQISDVKTPSGFSVFTYPRLIMVSAVIAAFIITGILYLNNSRESGTDNIELTYDDLIQAGMDTQFDNSMLVDHYLSISADSTLIDEQGNNKKMNDYLIENDIDISLIINEL